jgi:hypothetical protein
MLAFLLACSVLVSDPGDPCDGSCAYGPVGLELYSASLGGSVAVTDDALTWRQVDADARWGDFELAVLEIVPMVPTDCSTGDYPSALGVGWRIETDAGTWEILPVVDVLTVEHGSEIDYCPEAHHGEWRITSHADDVATATPL